MTDGIIQEVFKKYMPLSYNESPLMLELIEKIKQNSSYLTYYECEALSLEQLIGDNQE